ncbi:hypothetical protein [Thalassobius sp. Cn5-15]|uniref:hypothetical protein n=1 Tax=Thalassobius sp. Cn5-15 TaxID=2917763 RepID=UPI001EF25691|nr:hypothetical protein [Thalassobius sp. Cn5-15]MCG7495164.1 hypothetical protein [Thalassobius sp. Cn5-15]
MALNLGTVIRFGASRNPSDLKQMEISRAANSAFEAMKRGRNSLSAAFREVREASGSPKPGFHTDFGAFARWLYRVDHGSAKYAKLLDIVTELAFNNYPFGPGDVLFGRTCRKRRIHNITSAAKQHRLKYPRMTSLVLGLGLGLGKDGCHERIEFSAQKYDPILNEFAQCLRPKPAARRIGVHLSMLQRLASAQILRPRFDFPTMLPVYHPDDLDEFTASVFEHTGGGLQYSNWSYSTDQVVHTRQMLFRGGRSSRPIRFIKLPLQFTNGSRSTRLFCGPGGFARSDSSSGASRIHEARCETLT